MIATHYQSARPHALLAALALRLRLGVVRALPAQVSAPGDKQTGDQYGNELPTVLNGAKVEQHLNTQIPLGAAFTDEAGRSGSPRRLLSGAASPPSSRWSTTSAPCSALKSWTA